jgi:hypothetical protein
MDGFVLREQFGAEEAGLDDGGVDAERLDLEPSDSIQPSSPNFEAA